MEVSGMLVAAHELKAPLCLMRQLAFALDIATSDAQKSRIQTQMIEVSERAMRQVNDLAKIARLEDGLFETEPVSVRGVCESVLQEITPLFRFEQRQISAHYSNKSRLAIANRDLLYSVVYNFCVNAVRYSDHDTASRLSVSDHHGKIRINVRDYGPALPTQVWRDLQTGQFVTPTSIAMRPGSSGLGLYIAATFTRHMHAQLGAIRHRDGTSFFVELPVSQQASLLS